MWGGLLCLLGIVDLRHVSHGLLLGIFGRDELHELRGGLLRARHREHVLLRRRRSSTRDGLHAQYILHGLRCGLFLGYFRGERVHVMRSRVLLERSGCDVVVDDVCELPGGLNVSVTDVVLELRGGLLFGGAGRGVVPELPRG